MNQTRHCPSVNANHRRSRKILVSALVLGLVFVAAAYQQYRGGNRMPDRAAAESERTVFGERPSPAASRSRAGTPNVTAEVESFLNVWRTTLMSGDAAAHADLYASRVDRFFRKRNVSQKEVRREKDRMLARYPEFRKYEISSIQVEEMEEDKAVVSFRKDWDARGRGQFAGAERQRLTLKKSSGEWKITGEEELKVYWVRRR